MGLLKHGWWKQRQTNASAPDHTGMPAPNTAKPLWAKRMQAHSGQPPLLFETRSTTGCSLSQPVSTQVTSSDQTQCCAQHEHG